MGGGVELRIGQRVRVRHDAPARLRPGAAGEVIDVRRLDDEGLGCAVCRGGGAGIATVRFRDGGAPLEVPEHLLVPEER